MAMKDPEALREVTKVVESCVREQVTRKCQQSSEQPIELARVKPEDDSQLIKGKGANQYDEEKETSECL